MNKTLKAWEKEKKLIPVMIRKYCHGKHKTKKKELCEECQKLKAYALYRLEKCPFKENKKFCSFCKIHCYTPEMRTEIKAVMKYAGPRLIPTHPIFSFSHVIQMRKYKKKLKKGGTTK
ncbi:MAG: nitrous oxide-stimulated promoter family protein [Anaeroplasmataceae bacterium]|nr:nitrous oxide-stimulated promoter family protein [Anaeroplasmataceae bacterium]